MPLSLVDTTSDCLLIGGLYLVGLQEYLGLRGCNIQSEENQSGVESGLRGQSPAALSLAHMNWCFQKITGRQQVQSELKIASVINEMPG